MKVSVVGAGNVGATAAERILEANLADITLIDIVEGKAQAIALDLLSAASITRTTRFIEGTTQFKALTGSDIVVVTAGFARKPGENRDDLLAKNAEVIADVSQKIVRYAPEAIIIMVTNPLDVMCYLALKSSGLEPNKVIGMGGVSDCSRLNMLISQELDVDIRSIHSLILGAHGDSMLILPRLSTAQGIPITDLLSKEAIEGIIERTRGFGAKIVQLLGHGSAYYGPSAGILQLVDSIVNDRKNIVCASIYLDGHYGLGDVCIGIPVKIGREGIEEIIELELTNAEKQAFLLSAEKVKESINKLGV